MFRCDKGERTWNVPCRVFLVPYDYQVPLIVASGGQTIRVSAGRYDLRAYSEGLALATNTTLTVTLEEQSNGPHGIGLTLGPGGTIAISPEALPPDGSVQLLSLSSGRVDTLFLERDRELPFPAGKAVAVLFAGPDKLIGVTSPFELAPRARSVVAGVHKPTDASGDIVVRVDFPPGAFASEERDYRTTLQSTGSERQASVSTNKNSDSHYSVFFDVPAGSYSLSLESGHWWAKKIPIEVQAGRLVLDDHLAPQPKPSLKVVLDSAVKPPTWKVSVYRCPEGELGPATASWPDLKRCSTFQNRETTSDQVALDHLDPAWVFVLVEAGLRRLGRQVDLTTGRDRTEHFDPRGVRVFGRVRRGKKDIAADLSFRNSDTEATEAEVRSAPDGTYETFVSDEGLYRVTVRPAELELPDSPVFKLRILRHEDLERDFDIPSSSVHVVILDERTRKPIPKAEVLFVYAGAGESRETDEQGEARLPPIAPGALKLGVGATGYARKTVTVSVEDQDAPQSAVVLLKPLQDEHSFRLLLPGGSPASSGIVFVGPYSEGFRERDDCDGEGICRLADRPGDEEMLFLFHPEAALTVARGSDTLGSTVTLRPPGGELKIEVQRGQTSASCVLRVQVFLEGVPVPRFLLAVLGTVLGRNYQTMLFPNFQQPLVIQGLPVGPVVIGIAPAEGADRRCGEGWLIEPFEVQLPTPSPPHVQLP